MKDAHPLTARLFKVYEDAKRELHYAAFRFLGKLRRDGGLKAAKYYLRPSKKLTQGFERLLEYDRLDLSVEAIALEPKWRRYFTEEELATARERLSQFGYFTRKATRSRSSGALSADELPDAATYPKGAKTSLIVSAYERNSAAREACIDHYGATCFVCGFDFEHGYGELGKGRIHVHHLTPFASRDGARETNPVVDLRPVCPNCHWMLHQRNPPIPVAELKTLVLGRRSEA